MTGVLRDTCSHDLHIDTSSHAFFMVFWYFPISTTITTNRGINLIIFSSFRVMPYLLRRWIYPYILWGLPISTTIVTNKWINPLIFFSPRILPCLLRRCLYPFILWGFLLASPSPLIEESIPSSLPPPGFCHVS